MTVILAMVDLSVQNGTVMVLCKVTAVFARRMVHVLMVSNVIVTLDTEAPIAAFTLAITFSPHIRVFVRSMVIVLPSTIALAMKDTLAMFVIFLFAMASQRMRTMSAQVMEHVKTLINVCAMLVIVVKNVKYQYATKRMEMIQKCAQATAAASIQIVVLVM